jgi:long-subunit fatty acid transport protein
MKKLSRSLLLQLVVSLSAVVASAQDPIIPLQFSFSDPGARSMGFGGAFVALADDATAAFSNPAGLVQLARPEISLEWRRWSYSTPYTHRGRVEGLPSGFGIDTVAGLRTATSDDTLNGLSFLSLAYPKERWSLAFFRHQLANFEFSTETQGLFAGGTNCCQERFWDQQVTTDFDSVSYGLSGAYRISDRFDIGFGIVYHESSLRSQATSFLTDDYPEGVIGPTSFHPERSILTQNLLGDGTDWGLNGGFLWRVSEGWRIGGVYRQGPEAELTIENRAGAAIDLGVPPGAVVGRITGLSVEFPPVLGLGFAYRVQDGGFTVSFQWDRIEYSTIVESLEEHVARLGESLDLAVDDADELHLGGEYVFLRSNPIIAVRAGAWLDPDHQLRDTSDDPFIRALQPPGDDQTHFTMGLGVAFKKFQIDFGIDLADTVDTASLSAIYSF